MGIRVATDFSARVFNLLITNVPGAQTQMYVAQIRFGYQHGYLQINFGAARQRCRQIRLLTRF